MRTSVAVALLAVLASGAARAQWRVGLAIGSTEYRGATRDTSGSASGARLRPGSAARYGVRVAYDARRVRIALLGTFARPGIAGVGGDLVFTDHSTGDVAELDATVGVRIARVGAGGSLYGEAGPALSAWDIDGEIRARWSALTALGYDWPVAGRLGGAIRLEGSVGPSPFDAAELPAELERRALWRYGVTLGLSYRL